MRHINAHWIWMGSAPPDYLLKNISHFRKLDSKKIYQYNIWMDRAYSLPLEFQGEGVVLRNTLTVFHLNTPFEALPLVESFFLREKYGAYKNYAAASDILRYVVLYALGGVYMDADAKVCDIDALSTIYQMAISSACIYVNTSKGRYYNNTIISGKNNEFWLNVFDYISSLYDQQKSYASKRHFDSSASGNLRVRNTVFTTGMGALNHVEGWKAPSAIRVFEQEKCFHPIDASAEGYRFRPAFLRHNSNLFF